ncbi:hypothetical protein AX14_012990 [Amanita brunnescens Koide BX004]|nr:hypothetical protein AX14_012990 [Amanita brunnescens Koide BX004]
MSHVTRDPLKRRAERADGLSGTPVLDETQVGISVARTRNFCISSVNVGSYSVCKGGYSSEYTNWNALFTGPTSSNAVGTWSQTRSLPALSLCVSYPPSWASPSSPFPCLDYRSISFSLLKARAANTAPFNASSTCVDFDDFAKCSHDEGFPPRTRPRRAVKTFCDHGEKESEEKWKRSREGDQGMAISHSILKMPPPSSVLQMRISLNGGNVSSPGRLDFAASCDQQCGSGRNEHAAR